MVTYYVRIWCEDCDGYKRTSQDSLDEDWKPEGCVSHTVRDFVIEKKEED